MEFIFIRWLCCFLYELKKCSIYTQPELICEKCIWNKMKLDEVTTSVTSVTSNFRNFQFILFRKPFHNEYKQDSLFIT